VKVTPSDVTGCESERVTYESRVRKNFLKFGQADSRETSCPNVAVSNIHDLPYVGLLWISKLSFKITVFKLGFMKCRGSILLSLPLHVICPLAFEFKHATMFFIGT
jgi:hypothetical protein